MKLNNFFKKLGKDEKAFTGLESAIVLTAFIVVAAVFSYVVLGAGFSTSDTAKATIDEGVKQTTSSIEMAGDVVAIEDTTTTNTVEYILVTVQLTAGQAPVDIGDDSTDEMLVISYLDNSTYDPQVSWTQTFIGANDGDSVLEQHEKVEFNITVPASMLTTSGQAVNREFRLEIKPKVGAILPISRTTPSDIDPYTLLL